MARLGVGMCGLAISMVACAPVHSGSNEASETATGSESESSAETGELDALLSAEPEWVLHPGQPMVVDLLVELDAPGTGELVHLSDDDVRVFLLEPGEGEFATELHFRVRGLLPSTEHELQLSVSEAEGPRADEWSGSVTTEPPLPGFLPKFELESAGPAAVEPIWRLVDMTKLFSTDPSGLFMVDDEGSTRWYLGDGDDYTDLDDIFTAPNLRSDGSVSFLRRDTGWIVDELGEVSMEVTAEQLGEPAGFHHELLELPNGNFLVLGYSFADIDYADEGTLHVAGDIIVEFTPAGELVWRWDSFDHFDPQRRRDGFFGENTMIPDPETGTMGFDWTHGNGLEYDAQSDTILLSMRHQDWISAIDHQSGEVLWNLGDEGDFELEGDTYWFFHQHSPQWQPDGTLLLYDNGVGNPERPDLEAHSRALRYALDFGTMRATMVWADDSEPFVAPVAGDADRMPGGHILRLDSSWLDPANAGARRARVVELDADASPNTVWTLYMPPGQFSYRAKPLSRFVGQPAP